MTERVAIVSPGGRRPRRTRKPVQTWAAVQHRPLGTDPGEPPLRTCGYLGHGSWNKPSSPRSTYAPDPARTPWNALSEEEREQALARVISLRSTRVSICRLTMSNPCDLRCCYDGMTPPRPCSQQLRDDGAGRPIRWCRYRVRAYAREGRPPLRPGHECPSTGERCRSGTKRYRRETEHPVRNPGRHLRCSSDPQGWNPYRYPRMPCLVTTRGRKAQKTPTLLVEKPCSLSFFPRDPRQPYSTSSSTRRSEIYWWKS